MTIRTVTVCSNCKTVFIVKKLPKTTTCRGCGKRHKFKKLKRYYQTEDKDAARKARTEFQARVRDLDDHFERAREKGVLEDTADQLITDDEYLDAKGVDPEAVADAEERAIEATHRQKSQKDIVLDAVTEQENPNRDDVRAYAEQFGMDGEKALKKLDKFREYGEVSGTYNGPFRIH